MKFVSYYKFRAVMLAAVLFAFSTAVYAQAPANANRRALPREFNMLVLGDSILWGQGLKTEHKSWYLVKNWIEQTRGVVVREKIEAHAGAMIGSAGAAPPKLLIVYGEVNNAYPTLHDQIDDALRSTADASQIDLVLVDGCINDINARRILNAANTPEVIQTLAQEKCGAPVEQLLLRIASSFPNAHIVSTGYYPVVTEKTPRDLFMRALAKRFYAPISSEHSKLSDKELFERLTSISRTWYEESNRVLMQAASNANQQLAAKGSRQRVSFAKVSFLPEHAFAARDSRLWGFDATTVRKLLAVVTLGWVSLRANDEVRSQRSSMCQDFFKKQPDETDDQERIRQDNLMVCRLAAIAHPNRKGAVMYADSIEAQLQNLGATVGWLRTTTATTASAAAQ